MNVYRIYLWILFFASVCLANKNARACMSECLCMHVHISVCVFDICICMRMIWVSRWCSRKRSAVFSCIKVRCIKWCERPWVYPGVQSHVISPWDYAIKTDPLSLIHRLNLLCVCTIYMHPCQYPVKIFWTWCDALSWIPCGSYGSVLDAISEWSQSFYSSAVIESVSRTQEPLMMVSFCH